MAFQGVYSIIPTAFTDAGELDAASQRRVVDLFIDGAFAPSASYAQTTTLPALERALASGTVACVNVMLDPEAPATSGAMGYAV